MGDETNTRKTNGRSGMLRGAEMNMVPAQRELPGTVTESSWEGSDVRDDSASPLPRHESRCP